jgi:hypothetical protein
MNKKWERISGIPTGQPSGNNNEKKWDETQRDIDQLFAEIPAQVPRRPLTLEEMRGELDTMNARNESNSFWGEHEFGNRIKRQGTGELSPEQMRAALDEYDARTRSQQTDVLARRFSRDARELGREVQGNALMKVYNIFDNPKFRRTEMDVANAQILRLIENFARGENQSDAALVSFLESQRVTWQGRNGEQLSTTLWNILSWNASHNKDEGVRREAAQILAVLNSIKQQRRTA